MHFSKDYIPRSKSQKIYITCIINYISPTDCCEAPNTPTLTSDLSTTPSEGDVIVLTCSTSSPYITEYRGHRDGTLASSGTTNFITFTALIGSNDGSWTCDVQSLNSQWSSLSPAILLRCKSLYSSEVS